MKAKSLLEKEKKNIFHDHFFNIQSTILHVQTLDRMGGHKKIYYFFIQELKERFFLQDGILI